MVRFTFALVGAGPACTRHTISEYVLSINTAGQGTLKSQERDERNFR